LPHDAALQSMLGGALREGSSPEDRAHAMGYCAGVMGLGQSEIDALLGSLSPRLQGRFRDGFATQGELADRYPEACAQARAELRRVCDEWNDGCAAAIGGWDRQDGSEVFRAARDRTLHTLEAHPREADAARATYRAVHREAFMAADAGSIDHRRAADDAAYRAGIAHFRQLEHGGDAGALESERRRIEGIAVRDLGQRISG
jgi:hypothetical protein